MKWPRSKRMVTAKEHPSAGTRQHPKNSSQFGLQAAAVLAGLSLLLPTTALAQGARTIRLPDTTAVLGQEITVPIQFIAQGNENALGFSVQFNPALMSFQGVAPGSAASGSSLNVNTNQAGSGRVGFALARPAGQQFMAGLADLLVLRLRMGNVVTNTTISFTDSPIVRETVDNAARVLTTLYQAGVITITPLFAPEIVTQPQGTTVYAGTNVTFTVAATGSTPMRFQWQFNGTNIPGATNTVLQPATCVSVPSGLVAWWPGENTADDIVGARNGTLAGGAGFASGEVGQAFSFDGSGYISVPHSALWDFGGNDFTIELWAKFNSPGGVEALMASDDGGGSQNKWILFHGYSLNGFCLHLNGSAGGNLCNSPFSPSPGQWYHFALARAGATWTCYVNGSIIGTDTSTVSVPAATAPLTIAQAEGSFRFNGLLDEVSIYSRALSAGEIADIYAGGSKGKCKGTPTAGLGNSYVLRNVSTNQSGDYRVILSNAGGSVTSAVAHLVVYPALIPPSITAQPVSRVLSVTESVVMSVQAMGSSPLRYQWRFNGSDLTGETNRTLILTNVATSHAGAYSAVVVNAAGSVTSQSATLAVSATPRMVRVVDGTAATGGLVDLPVELVALGEENALGFSLSFDPARVSYRSMTLGAGAAGMLLQVNTNSVSSGLLGVAMSKQAGEVFSAGTFSLLNVRFQAGGVSGTNSITFTNSPIATDLADVWGKSRVVSSQGGSIIILSTPPSITTQPVSQTNRIFTSPVLQVSANGSLPLFYQWFFNGVPLVGATNAMLVLNNLTPSMAGNYQVVVTNVVNAVTSSVAKVAVQRVVRVVSTNGPTGNLIEVPVELLAGGDENSLGFSLRCDPTRLVLREVVLPAGATNLTLYANTNSASQGLVGVVVAQAPPAMFQAGTQQVARLRFQATEVPGSADLTFTDTPIARELADSNARPRATAFVNGGVLTAQIMPTITQQPVPRDVESSAVVTFTVAASGSLPMTYQWRRNGVNLTGATNPTYVIVNAQPANNGSYGVEIHNLAGSAFSSNVVLTVTPPDTTGPLLTFPRYGSIILADGMVVSNADTFAVTASDPSGVSRVEFYVDGTLIGSDNNPSDGFSAFWNVDLFPDGPHKVMFRGYDGRNNLTVLSNSVTLALAPPPAPTIGVPVNGTVVSDLLITVRGNALKNTSVVLYRNGSLVGTPVPVSVQGIFETTIPLVEGTNRLQAAAQNRGGEGPKSPVVIAMLDTSLPPPPNAVQATARDAGRIQVSWVAPTDSLKGYHVYRASASFTNKTQATRLTLGGPTADTTFLDSPPGDGKYFYRVSTVNLANTEGSLSSEASAVSDTTPPVALLVIYRPQTNYDAATQRFGRGLVDVTVRMSEPLLAVPFFSLTPSNGLPIIVDLRSGGSNDYVGTFAITESTPSGMASAVLSARDPAGNRGSTILSGDQILIDTTGPEVKDLAIQPSRVLRNDSNAPVLVTFIAQLTEAIRSNALPQFTYTLSQTSPAEQPVASLTPGTNNLNWIVGFTLPANAGVPVETLTLLFRGEDALGNVGTRIQAPYQFQVYQGALPPLESPVGLSAKSLPAGAIQLGWSSVPGAVDYQLYRKTPAQPDFTALTRSGTALLWTETPPLDGSYQYAVASVRRENGQEAISPWGNVASASSDRVAPGAPTSLVVELAGNGAYAHWTAPAGATEPITYNLYRTNRGPITVVSNSTPLIRGIPISQVVDPSPTPFQPYYAVAAVDSAGNLSPPSNTGYLNSELMPPSSLSVWLVDSNVPVISWTQTGNTIAGHNLYLGEDSALVKLNNTGLITTRIYTDTGYAGDDRRYTVAAVDQNQQQSIGRSLRLPRLTAALATNAIVRRGLMNELFYAVQNNSSNDVINAQIQLSLGGRIHLSPAFDLAAGAGTNLSVIVGGYPELPVPFAPLTNTIAITPDAGDTAMVVRSGQVAVGDGQLIIGVMASGVLRGGSATVQFSLLNPGGAELEVIAAQSSGASPSPHIRFTLLDPDGNVLSVAPFKANSGPHVVNLPNGNAVLRLAGGEQAISAQTVLPIPMTAPDHVFVRVDIDKVYYHSDQEDRVEMDGVQTRQDFTVVETSYTGEVDLVDPAESNGDQPILISGLAQFRRTGQPAPNVPMVLKIANSGFVRAETLLTDANGVFSTVFQPLAGEAGGVYSVWAVHPDLNDSVVQQTFVIRRLLVSPSSFTVRAPYSVVQPVPLTVSTGPGTTVTNLHLEYRAQDQPDGAFPQGIAVGLDSPVPLLPPSQSATFNLTFAATAQAPRSGSLVLLVTSDAADAQGWQKINVAYEFSEGQPSLRWSPSFVDTGVAPSNSVTETVSFQNVGLASATGLRFTLLNTDGTPAPAWASLTTPPNLPELAVGDRFDAGLAFQPPAGTPEGDYQFVLGMRAQNYPSIDLGVHVAVVTSGRGDVLFKIVDMFTRSDGTNFLDGVAGARIRLENELVSSFYTNLVTDANGETNCVGLPVGQYKFQVTADNHNSYNGRFWIRAGTTVNQQVALTYSLVTVEWEVVPITIQDRYEITLNATFQTDVPAPVVTIEPGVVNLPQLFAGDVYYGEYSLYNHGLIRADHLQFQLPASDDYFDYQVLAGVPDHLDAKQRVRIPYRLTCKRSMPGPNQQLASGVAAIAVKAKAGAKSSPKDGSSGDCFSYQTCVLVGYDWVCINGLWFKAALYSCYYYSYTRGCPSSGGGGGGGGPAFGGGGGAGGGTTYSPGGGTPLPGPQCYPDKPCSQEGVCDLRCQDQREKVSSWVGLLSREYQDEIEDLRTKVPGGDIAVLRQFYTNQWNWADLGRRLGLQQINAGASAIQRNLVSYGAVNTEHTVFDYRGNRIVQELNGYRWRDKDGAWEFYDLNGVLQSSGRRNLALANYIYDGSGRLVGVNDRNGRRIFTYEYSADQLVAVADLSGRRVEYAWTNARLTKVHDVMGQDATYEYNGTGRITRKTDVNGRTVNVTYDNGGYVYSVLDDRGNGKYFQYNYDKNTRQYYAQVRTSGSQVKEVTFDQNGDVANRANNGIQAVQVLRDGRTEITTNPNQTTTRREYDEFGNLLKETRPDGGVTQYEYELQYHQPVTITDPRGMVTVLSYDANGNLTNKIEALGTPIARTNSWVYSADNLLLRRIGARGNKMDYEYDTAGNLTREFDPDNPAYQTLYAYDLRGNRVGVTNAVGYATLYGYDNANRLLAETNALGYVTLYSYGSNQLTQVETGRDGTNRGRIVRYRYDDQGRQTQTVRVDAKDMEHVWKTTSYDSDGRVVVVANALGQATRYEYNPLGQRAKISRPFSDAQTSDTQFLYDEFGRLYREADPLGFITQYDYDAMDQQRKVTEAVGTEVQRSRESFYDLSGNITQITYSDATNVFSTFYDYDLLNRRVAIRGARELPQTFEYDANDNLVAEINGRDYRTEYAYDQHNRRSITVKGKGHGNPGDVTQQFGYDLLSRQVALTDGNTNTAFLAFDALGRRIAESAPNDPSLFLFTNIYSPWNEVLIRSNLLGGVERRLYDSFARLTNTVDAAGLSLDFQYDEADRLLSIQWPNGSSVNNEYTNALLFASRDRTGHRTEYGYDIAGQKVLERLPTGLTRTFSYDALSRPVSESNSLGHVTRTYYDMFGKPVRIAHPDGLCHYLQYNAYGQVTNQFGAGQYPLVSQYDATGNRTALVDANHNQTTWDYDARDRVARKTYADASFYLYSYNGNSNLRTRQDARGITTAYLYDSANRMTLVDHPTDPDVVFHYDVLGRRTQMVDASGTNRWFYDVAGRVVTNTQSRGNAVVAYQYNAEGNRTKMSLNGSETAYTYDAAGRLNAISNAAGVFSYGWLPDANQVQAIVYPNGGLVTNTYNQIGWLSERRNLNPDATDISSFAYGYDALGMRTNVLFGDRSGYVYRYDSLRQLTVAHGFSPDGTANPNQEFSYIYDAAGNRMSATNNGTATVYSINELNQYLLSVTASARPVTNALAYDANGNMILELSPTRYTSYAWDEANRLAAVTNGAHRSEFLYNGLGFLVESREYENGSPQQTIRRVYDGSLPVADVSQLNEPVRSYFRGMDLSRTLEHAGGIGGLLALQDERANVVAFCFSDGNGNVVDLLSLGGDADAHYKYAPFGQLMVANGPLSEQPYQWSSKEASAACQLNYYGYRHYSPSTGRWNSRDPAGEKDASGLYVFVRNDPINYVDAFGLSRVKTACQKHGCVGYLLEWLNEPGEDGTCDHSHYPEDLPNSHCFKTFKEAQEYSCRDGTIKKLWAEMGTGAGGTNIRHDCKDRSQDCSYWDYCRLQDGTWWCQGAGSSENQDPQWRLPDLPSPWGPYKDIMFCATCVK